ncbi:hypothetical protein CDD83_1656 [Cordyceps sp. RAO-2017]|nr:hypothetical protein CDD83_1656 [Cordyceps sp. RAO-2017]
MLCSDSSTRVSARPRRGAAPDSALRTGAVAVAEGGSSERTEATFRFRKPLAGASGPCPQLAAMLVVDGKGPNQRRRAWKLGCTGTPVAEAGCQQTSGPVSFGAQRSFDPVPGPCWCPSSPSSADFADRGAREQAEGPNDVTTGASAVI